MEDNKNIVELQAEQLELVVSEKTIGSLTTNAKQIRDLVQSALPKYDISNYSTDDVAKAKADKAVLNKAAKTLNDKRIAFEKEFMAPFGEFKNVVTETVGLIKEAVSKIDVVIKQDEQRAKDEKTNSIKALDEVAQLEAIGISIERVWNDKWLNKSTSLKAVAKEISEKIVTITSEMETLKSFAEDYDVLVVRYKENLNLQDTVRYANQLKEQREASKAQAEDREEQKAVAEASAAPQTEQQAEAKPADVKTQEPEPQAEESSHHDIDQSEADAADAFADIMGQSAGTPKSAAICTRLYEINATDDKFKELEAFMDNLGITYSNRDRV